MIISFELFRMGGDWEEGEDEPFVVLGEVVSSENGDHAFTIQRQVSRVASVVGGIVKRQKIALKIPQDLDQHLVKANNIYKELWRQTRGRLCVSEGRMSNAH